ncbi:hypothetical protein CSKR_102741 [Clonorchis sinensis]|uniref:Uncharacterized protein n=1 Tax=Clonorchis sinensis TaxID=79923 RepID=A0A3R7CFD1_CLOSI|nr:hypothetical protein CSKR_102741 [Clonorchis sinensis]
MDFFHSQLQTKLLEYTSCALPSNVVNNAQCTVSTRSLKTNMENPVSRMRWHGTLPRKVSESNINRGFPHCYGALLDELPLQGLADNYKKTADFDQKLAPNLTKDSSPNEVCEPMNLRTDDVASYGEEALKDRLPSSESRLTEEGFRCGAVHLGTPTEQLQTIEQGSKTLICISFTKPNIHLLLERVFLNFSGYSLTVTQMRANATKRLHKFRNRSHFSIDGSGFTRRLKHYRSKTPGLSVHCFGPDSSLLTGARSSHEETGPYCSVAVCIPRRPLELYWGCPRDTHRVSHTRLTKDSAGFQVSLPKNQICFQMNVFVKISTIWVQVEHKVDENLGIAPTYPRGSETGRGLSKNFQQP